MFLNKEIYNQSSFLRDDIIAMLSFKDEQQKLLIEKAKQTTIANIGNKVFLRGLIEYSNKCIKNCFYCGIRKGNKNQLRYKMNDEEVLSCARFAFEKNYGSIVIQSGERTDTIFINKIEDLIKRIKILSNNKLGITLSLGEQNAETYKRWFDAGAHRYLLRIETSDKALYSIYHPSDDLHNFDKRLEALHTIKKIGYQLGTGVMIGLPGQTIENLADDLLFIRHLDADMIGMGPYIEHEQTPMYKDKGLLLSLKDRFNLSINMISVLRLLMPTINIAATTAMQTIDPIGREKAINAGANIIMPNLTPLKYRHSYLLYNGKPCLDEDSAKCNQCMIFRIKSTGSEIGFGEWGDSKHFKE